MGYAYSGSTANADFIGSTFPPFISVSVSIPHGEMTITSIDVAKAMVNTTDTSQPEASKMLSDLFNTTINGADGLTTLVDLSATTAALCLSDGITSTTEIDSVIATTALDFYKKHSPRDMSLAAEIAATTKDCASINKVLRDDPPIGGGPGDRPQKASCL